MPGEHEYLELFHMTSATIGGGETSELLCNQPSNEPWSINTCIAEHTLLCFKILVSLGFVTSCRVIMNISIA